MRRRSALESRWERLFRAAWQRILDSEDLQRLPPRIRLQFSRRMDSSLCARIEWNGMVRVVMATKFGEELHRELDGLGPTLASLAFRSSAAQRRRRSEVIAAIEEIALSFILHHECFHLLGGHMEWAAERRGIAHFNEQQLGMASVRRQSAQRPRRPSRSDLSTSYVLESEADSNAIQWLIQYADVGGLRRLLGTTGEAVMDLAPRKRQTAFRLVLAAVWLIIRKLEASRVHWLHQAGKEHPLPVTRLFIAFGTFLQEYAVISDLKFDEAGGAQHRLRERDVAAMREFLRHILGPVLKADWSPGRKTLPPHTLEDQMRFYFPDFANHMLNWEVTTDVGREMLAMEGARFRMDRILKPYRFFPTVELRRRNPRRG